MNEKIVSISTFSKEYNLGSNNATKKEKDEIIKSLEKQIFQAKKLAK